MTDHGQSFQTDSSQGPYEGQEDALIGVVNGTSHTIASLQLSAGGVFSFDQDGICTPANWPVPGGPSPAGCPFNAGPGGYVPNGYEGPRTWFSGVSPDGSTGVVNFNPQLAPGDSAYFSLESPPSGQTIVVGAPTSISTTLTGGGSAGPSITVPQGTLVSDAAVLAGSNSAGASGTVTYTVYKDSACSSALTAWTVNVAGGAIPVSPGIASLAPGTYYWGASYSGDPNNQPAATPCGSEILVVGPTPVVTCGIAMTGVGSFEPAQGVWQDDAGAAAFADQPGKQLRVIDPAHAVAELDMVRDRDTLLFGTRPLASRAQITLRGTSDGTTMLPMHVRFKLDNGALHQDLYDSPPTSELIGPPCTGAVHTFSVTVDSRRGLPASPGRPFKFVFTGPYTLTAIGVSQGHELPALQSRVTGQVDATNAPTFEFIPVSLGAHALDAAAQQALANRADAMASSFSRHLSDYFPIATGPVTTNTTPYRHFDLAVPSDEAKFVDAAFAMLHVPRQVVHLAVAFETLVNDLALATDYYRRYSRTIVVMRAADFATVHFAGAQAFTPAQKVIFMRDDSNHFDIAHEVAHTLPYLWSEQAPSVPMVETCKRPFHNLNLQIAHGFQITSAGRVIRVMKDPLLSIMGAVPASDPLDTQWIDQCTYWHVLHQLESVVDPPAILVQGLLAQRGAGAAGMLMPAYELRTQLDPPGPAISPWAIVLRGARGKVLVRHPFTPVFTFDDPHPRPVTSFSLRIRALRGIRTIELVGPSGVLDRRRFSAKVPKLILATRLTAVATKTQRGLLVVWSGRSAPGTHLLYTLIGSYDRGRNWSPAVIQQPAGGIRLLVTRHSHLLLKLIASDGTRSAVVARTVAIG